jgi:hypothetical protein
VQYRVPLEEEPEIRIFGLKEASRGLIQFLGETQTGFAMHPSGQGKAWDEEWGLEDPDRSEEE